ncbi:MAG: fucose isomerase, partial [Clostridiaceae bacterium]|nr:fucose isomerase [Clostridiaceae bacterium]
MEAIKIGYIPTRRNVFDRNEALRYNQLIHDAIGGLGAEVVDISDTNDEGLLFQEKDLSAVIDKMKAENVDGLFFAHCNFGTEDLVAKVARALGLPVLIWGPRDDAPLEDGLRTRDTQCGLFATGKVLRRFNVPFTYIENCQLEDDEFISGYQKFISVCSAVRAFRKIRVLQLGPRPDGFWSVISNEGELIERFNIHTFPVSLIDLVDLTKKIMDEEGDEFTKALDQISSTVCIDGNDEEDVRKIAALKVAIKSMCKEHGCTCVAIQCWNALQSGLGIMPCMVNGMLAEEGLPVVCETDIHGAVTAILLQEASRNVSPVFFADLTVRHPENDNAELLWHCGNFPPSLADENSDRELGRHFIFPGHKCGTGEWKIKNGDVTVLRFDGDHGEYRLFIGEGKGIDGPKTKGTYFWLEVDNWVKWEKVLVEGPYIHHCAGVHGKFADVLEEVCKYIPGIIVD